MFLCIAKHIYSITEIIFNQLEQLKDVNYFNLLGVKTIQSFIRLLYINTMMHKEQNDEECDARDVAQGYAAYNKIIIQLQ